MGGPQEAKWPRICSNSKHKKVFTVTQPGVTVRSSLYFNLEQIRGHFYSGDPPMSVGKSGLGFALTQSRAEILQVL